MNTAEEEFRQRIDSSIGALLENFGGLIKTAQIRDKTNTTREALQTSVYATSLVQASEALLKAIYELKLSVALGDFETMNDKVKLQHQEMNRRSENAHQLVEQLNSHLTHGLIDLEGHYYQTRWRSRPSS